jgi:AhpD family alkylhydroperoxidase
VIVQVRNTSEDEIMETRLDLFASPATAKALKHFASASMVIIKDSALPAATRDLVMLRASQINGCGYCTDVHSKDLAHAGESAARINLVAAWRESTVFSDAERAALELAEQGTRIADAAGGVTDEAWANAASHYDEEQLAALVFIIATINASNRIGVINRQAGGDYQPGQFGY